MGFTGSSSAVELAAQEDLEQEDADFETEINYEAELADAAAPDVEPDPDIEFLDALQANDQTVIFEWFFREQARLAFLARGN